eukprot:SAG31_NODE_747_length_12395_cov_129.196405_6_plen_118_part_00
MTRLSGYPDLAVDLDCADRYPDRSILPKSEVPIFTPQIGSDRACSTNRRKRSGQISTPLGISNGGDKQLSVDVRHAMVHAPPAAQAAPAPPPAPRRKFGLNPAPLRRKVLVLEYLPE